MRVSMTGWSMIGKNLVVASLIHAKVLCYQYVSVQVLPGVSKTFGGMRSVV